MALTPGTILGPYEILGFLGAGGMGEVYRARDIHLNREVALKALPSSVSADADRLARFKREAQVLASLNHPNIGGIHGFEESSGIRALVLELVEGPTLEDRLARGPIPLDEVRTIAHQLCDALEAAHERNIVHRDLKPANIKLRPDGTSKVLDFGLAKALDPAPYDSAPDLTSSPTITSPAMTRMGVILGTAAYMSPEQARGSVVDARTDIWAFGCVLYEMLAGRRAFPGESVSDTIAAIIEREPVWSALPAATPEPIRRLLRRCLTKDARLRLRHIADARIEIDETPTAAGSDRRASSASRLSWLVTAAFALLAAVAGGVVVWRFTQIPAASQARGPVARLLVVPEESLPIGPESLLAVSPDGREMAYVGGTERARRLYLRRIDQFDSRPVPGTEGADAPLFSPDGQWLAFIADRKLKKISVSGGTALVLSDVTRAEPLAWNPIDNTILFNPGPASGIWRVPAGGGKPSELTQLAANEIDHRYPDVLPDGSALLFNDFGGTGGQQIYVQSLKTGQRHRLTTGVGPHYLATGHIVYVLDGTLYAMPFDAARLEATGQPTALIEGIFETTSAGSETPQMSVSRTGTLVYLSGSTQPRQNSLEWVGHDGRETPAGPASGSYAVPRLSPTGRRLAVRFGDAARNTGDVHLYDFARETWNRFTTDGNTTLLLWTPDGKQLTLGARKDDRWTLDSRSLDGTTSEAQLLDESGTVYPLSWSPDGNQLAIVTIDALTATDIAVLDRRKTDKPHPFLNTKAREGGPTFSPDGRWIAYVSDKSGRNEIYMRPYPGPGEEWAISTDGGNEPSWARNAPLLFYRRDDAMMVVDVVTTPAVLAGKPRRLFERPYAHSNAFWPNYDVTPDGQRLLMVKSIDQSTAKQINVVVNWFDELKQRVPASQ